MNNGHPLELSRLADKFPARDIEWRVQSCGLKGDKVWAKVLAYVTNRAIMERLDSVCGPGGWRNEFKEWNVGGQPGVLCGISVLVNGEWITKWDGAENTDIEAVKGGLSSAMKRAAVQWGVGRYLYDLDEGWAEVSENGIYYARTKEGKPFHWNPPALPSWALPKGSPEPPHDSVEANRLPKGDRAEARQANPQPRTAFCTDEQKASIERLGHEAGVDKSYWSDVLKFYDVKRLSNLTEIQANEVILDLSKRRTNQLLTELAVNLDDVRQEDKSVTADTPNDLDQSQAAAALLVLRGMKERQPA